MKVAYFGGDWFLSCIKAWQSANHQITHVFTHGEVHYNRQLRQWATQNRAKLITAKPRQSDMQLLLNEGVDCLFCVEYPWLIPCVGFPFKSINVHPSMLPDGKGPTPISWIVHSNPSDAGVTFHTLDADFDSGDIIYQERLKLTPHDSVDTLLARLELEVPRMLIHILNDLDNLYQNAESQTEGSYWPKMTMEDRTIRWTHSCKEIRHIVRASGHFGVAAAIDNKLYLIKHIQCVEHAHTHLPGQIFKEDDRHLFITTSDGICVIDKSAIIESQPLR